MEEEMDKNMFCLGKENNGCGVGFEFVFVIRAHKRDASEMTRAWLLEQFYTGITCFSKL